MSIASTLLAALVLASSYQTSPPYLSSLPYLSLFYLFSFDPLAIEIWPCLPGVLPFCSFHLPLRPFQFLSRPLLVSRLGQLMRRSTPPTRGPSLQLGCCYILCMIKRKAALVGRSRLGHGPSLKSRDLVAGKDIPAKGCENSNVTSSKGLISRLDPLIIWDWFARHRFLIA
jgi:hypothetical protein